MPKSKSDYERYYECGLDFVTKCPATLEGIFDGLTKWVARTPISQHHVVPSKKWKNLVGEYIKMVHDYFVDIVKDRLKEYPEVRRWWRPYDWRVIKSLFDVLNDVLHECLPLGEKRYGIDEWGNKIVVFRERGDYYDFIEEYDPDKFLSDVAERAGVDIRSVAFTLSKLERMGCATGVIRSLLKLPRLL